MAVSQMQEVLSVDEDYLRLLGFFKVLPWFLLCSLHQRVFVLMAARQLLWVQKGIGLLSENMVLFLNYGQIHSMGKS